MSTAANAALVIPWKDPIADGNLAEYWLNADSLLFSQQLGVRKVPAPS